MQGEDITLVNIYAPNIGAPKYIKQMLIDIKGETGNNTIIVRDFNTPLTSMNRSSRQKINKVTVVLKDTIGTSLVVQWLAICLPVQGTLVRSLVWEDPTCRGATKSVCHNYRACTLEPASHNY